MESIIQKENFVKQLQEFQGYTETYVRDVLNALGWSEDYILQRNDSPVTCPFDSHHILPEASLKTHLESCEQLHKGNSQEDLEDWKNMPSSCFFNERSTTVVSTIIDKEMQAGVLSSVENSSYGGYGHQGAAGNKTVKEVPLTNDRSICDLTPSERLALYNYCIEKAKAASQKTSISQDELMFLTEHEKSNEDSNKHQTMLDKMAEMRDFRRRRQSYRAKNVHTTKKSHTEVIRDVISSQMEVWEKLIRDVNQTEESGEGNTTERSKEHGEESNSGELDRGHRYKGRDRRSRHNSPMMSRKQERSSHDVSWRGSPFSGSRLREASARHHSRSPSQSPRLTRRHSRSHSDDDDELRNVRHPHTSNTTSKHDDFDDSICIKEEKDSASDDNSSRPGHKRRKHKHRKKKHKHHQ